ncbi:MAG: CHAT domain-containing protein [Lyngbya sp. HA4199-MV5]|jgi:CHAT domain-containing protein|nr:CHAT domain-containing protein [Lyngbya sp. HA4199-MV5]
MKPLLKHCSSFYTFACRQKRHYRIVFILMVVAFVSTITIHAIAAEKNTAPVAVSSSNTCLQTPSLNGDNLSRLGMEKYQAGQFGEARDCWRRARTLHRGRAAIADQINQAQAEQALGLYPLAYKTLLPLYYSPTTSDCKVLPKGDIDQADRCIQQFFDQLKKRADTFDKIAGLRSLGNLLRGIGELELSEAVLSLDILTRLPNKAALWLDQGNTKRALTEQSWDLYLRSGEPNDLKETIQKATEAMQQYAAVNALAASTAGNTSIDLLQAQLNQFSFLLEQQRELSCLLNHWRGPGCQLNQLRQVTRTSERQTIQQLLGKVQGQLIQFLTGTDSSNSLAALFAQIEQLPANHSTLHLRLNLAQSLIALSTIDLPGIELSQWQKQLEPWLKTTVALTKLDSREHSYALGYLGKWYQNTNQWESAERFTREALLQAQSIPAQEIAYQWQWQLAQLYKTQAQKQLKAKAQTEPKDLKTPLLVARKFYQGAYETLESLRHELAASNPDTQLTFQQNIETIYREYAGILLPQDAEPNPADLVEAREVIAALQAVELENFLRQGCPENSLERIDRIIDTEADKSTASFYPIVLDNEDGQTVRLEVILKLPGNALAAQSQPQQKALPEDSGTVRKISTPTNDTQDNGIKLNQEPLLKHYRKTIDRAEFTQTIKKLQHQLEEDYTFLSVKQEAHKVYQWLIEEAEKSGDLNRIHTLVFALDTRLRNIPLAALVYDPNLDSGDRQGYLIEKYAVAIAPRLRLQAAERFPAKKLNVLAVGLSDKPAVEFQGRLKGRFFPKLPYVEKELKTIELSGQGRLSVLSLLNEQFTQDQFQQAINTTSIQILHLATHGEFSSRPERTFLLSADKHVINVTELERIFRERNQNQARTIDLLVLSACETATSDQRATLGISGVAVRAGARGAIASLWTLDDKVSADFTKILYEKLIDPKLTKVQALREAQLELARVAGYQHPRYWAPYIFVGNWL